jgi:uncharacterized protein YjcR
MGVIVLARAPDERYQSAYELFKQGKRLIEIANELELPEGTVRRWKSTHKWDCERSDSKSERSQKKKGGQPGNKNAVGNNGGAPEQNKNAEKHGFFSKWLPEETAKIIGEIASENPLDILWDNILIQRAAIIRAQNIMLVTGKDEIIKEVVRTKVKSKVRETEKTTTTDNEEETEYAFQFAWDRQATFMNAQSRAMKTLEGMLKQYDEMVHKNWELATEEQKARIALIKKQASDGNTSDEETGIVLIADVIPDTEDGGVDG